MQDHVDNQIAKVAKVSLLHVRENVAVMLVDQPAMKNDDRSAQFVLITASVGPHITTAKIC